MNLPEFLQPLFWEYKLHSIDTEKHSFAVMSRIMERGSWEAVNWLKKVYANEQIEDFLMRKGKDTLPPRELNYWLLISDVTPEERRKLVDIAKTKHASWRGHAF